MQTPRFCGFCSIAGTLDLAFCGTRPLRTSWLIVGINSLHLIFCADESVSAGRPFRAENRCPLFLKGRGSVPSGLATIGLLGWEAGDRAKVARGAGMRRKRSVRTSLKRSTTNGPKPPGYSDGCPREANATPIEKSQAASSDRPPDMTGNVQLYLTEAAPVNGRESRMAGRLCWIWLRVKGHSQTAPTTRRPSRRPAITATIICRPFARLKVLYIPLHQSPSL